MHNNLHNIRVNRGLFTWNYLTQKVMSNVKIFQGINITLFFKNKHIFEKSLYYSLFGKKLLEKIRIK